ncbi:MAG TPA: Ku protein, partial [Luteimonas sp.]|nr:Ku protein [Luteimonas sp.]
DPSEYKNEFRSRLEEVIRNKMKADGVVSKSEENKFDLPEDATTNVVDFMALLQKSISSNKRTPAKGGDDAAEDEAPAKTGKKATARKAAKKVAKKAAKKAAAPAKAPARKAG